MLKRIMLGSGLGARLVRSSGWVFFGYFASQALRLASNLVLTRLLFPEAFGMMALISVFLVGLVMLSEIGVTQSIQQSARGDEPEFLDTAWVIQVVRGAALCLFCVPLGLLVAWIYDEPRFVTMLPVAGIGLLIAGFTPTRVETAGRNLVLGRLTVLDLISQVVGLAVMLVLAWLMQSVWALVIGGVVSAAVRVAIMHLFMPGSRNQLRWDRTSAKEIVTFGKWIFLSTLCGFLLSQSDKAILGKFLTLYSLGIYNIGYFFAGFPQALAVAIMSKIMIPLHRESPPADSAHNYQRVRKVRIVATAGVLTAQFAVAIMGTWFVGLLYDDRFHAAGAVVVAVTCMNVPYLIGMTYDYAAFGAGDSRGVFRLLVAKTVSQLSLFVLGMYYFGLAGALAGLCASQILVHPVVIGLARKHKAWDPWHDLFFGVVGLGVAAAIIHFQWDVLAELSSFSVAQ